MTEKFRSKVRKVIPDETSQPDLAATSQADAPPKTRELSPIKWGKVTDIGKDFRPMSPGQAAPLPSPNDPPQRPSFARTPVPSSVPAPTEEEVARELELEVEPEVVEEEGPDPKDLSALRPASISDSLTKPT